VSYFLQQLINGLQLGFVYALIALGYTMIYGIVRLINFAHGDVFMVGAFVSMYFLTTPLGQTGPISDPALLVVVLVLAFAVTMLAGLAPAEAIEQVTGLRVGLKWPNDVVIEQAARSKRQEAKTLKLGGILSEASIAGEAFEFAVVGLGLNINVDFRGRADLPEATSLMMELGHEVDRLAILRALVERFAARYAVIERDGQLPADWSARLTTLGRQVVARRGDESIVGLAEGVDESGALLIRTDDGALRRVDAADVTLRSGYC